MIFEYDEKSEDVYGAVFILFMAGFGAGFQLQNAPSITKAKESATKIFGVVDDATEIDLRKESGE